MPQCSGASALHKLYDEPPRWEHNGFDSSLYKIADSKNVIRGSAYTSQPNLNVASRTAFKRPTSPPVKRSEPARGSPRAASVSRERPEPWRYAGDHESTSWRFGLREDEPAAVLWPVPADGTHCWNGSSHLENNEDQWRPRVRRVHLCALYAAGMGVCSELSAVSGTLTKAQLVQDSFDSRAASAVVQTY